MAFMAKGALAAGLLALSATGLAADDFPSRALRVVVPYAAGGPSDTGARSSARKTYALKSLVGRLKLKAVIAGMLTSNKPFMRTPKCEDAAPWTHALRIAMRGTPAAVHERDAYEFWLAMLPPRTPRGVVVVDPPYEQTDERARITVRR